MPKICLNSGSTDSQRGVLQPLELLCYQQLQYLVTWHCAKVLHLVHNLIELSGEHSLDSCLLLFYA